MTDAALDQQDLPTQILELVALIGYEPSMVIVRQHGGGGLRVPARFNPDCPLVRLIGPQATLAMISRYGGSVLNIARCARALRVRRNIEIAGKYPGIPVPVLARTYQLTERQVWNILKDPATVRTETPQVPLFD